MAQIGSFTRGEDGTLNGTIRTLSLNVKARFVPTEPSSNEKAPALRVFAGPVEIGAAWKRTSKDNSVYHSVKLDDPSFPTPIFANLVEVEGGLRARLVALIRRPRRRARRGAAASRPRNYAERTPPEGRAKSRPEPRRSA